MESPRATLMESPRATLMESPRATLISGVEYNLSLILVIIVAVFLVLAVVAVFICLFSCLGQVIGCLKRCRRPDEEETSPVRTADPPKTITLFSKLRKALHRTMCCEKQPQENAEETWVPKINPVVEKSKKDSYHGPLFLTTERWSIGRPSLSSSLNRIPNPFGSSTSINSTRVEINSSTDTATSEMKEMEVVDFSGYIAEIHRHEKRTHL